MCGGWRDDVFELQGEHDASRGGGWGVLCSVWEGGWGEGASGTGAGRIGRVGGNMEMTKNGHTLSVVRVDSTAYIVDLGQTQFRDSLNVR